MNIEMKNGHVVEFRLHLKEMDIASNGIGHKLYEERRTLEALSESRILTKQEKIKIRQLKKQEIELYSNAWQKIINNQK